jgi:hypothetical protein
MREEEGNKLNQSMERIRASVFAGSMVLGTLVQVAGAPAFADEYEAPTVFTGESVMVRSSYRGYHLQRDSYMALKASASRGSWVFRPNFRAHH